MALQHHWGLSVWQQWEMLSEGKKWHAENPELQCRSSSKSVNCRDSSVSFPYRVGHIIPWVLPKKPVTVRISDSHGPGKMSHHILLWHRLPQHHQYHCVLIWGSCVAALGMDGETMLLRESGQEWRETLGGKKKLVFSLLCKANIQSAFFYRPQQYILFSL